jgi:hypothetical protein
MTKQKSTPKPAVKETPKIPEKIEVPVTGAELHKALDMIMEAPILQQAVNDVIGQALWIIKCQTETKQCAFECALKAFLDNWGKGQSILETDASIPITKAELLRLMDVAGGLSILKTIAQSAEADDVSLAQVEWIINKIADPLWNLANDYLESRWHERYPEVSLIEQ